MNNPVEIILALFFLSCLMLAASSRMLHCIRLVSMQGILLGILPLVFSGHFNFAHAGTAAINIGIKAVALPLLLYMAMKKAKINRELEPLVGYSVSVAIVTLIAGFSFWLGNKLPLPAGSGNLSKLAVATAFTVLMTGLFIVTTRKKALTQVIGFLIFENGITLFGIGMMKEHTILIELGILLDVLVLVMIMGIAICQISRKFEHIDADKLNRLDDLPEKEAE